MERKVSEPIEKFDELTEETATQLIEAFEELNKSSEQLREASERFWISTLELLVNEIYHDFLFADGKASLLKKHYDDSKWYNKWWRKLKWLVASRKKVYSAGLYYLAKQELDDFLKQIKEKV